MSSSHNLPSVKKTQHISRLRNFFWNKQSFDFKNVHSLKYLIHYEAKSYDENLWELYHFHMFFCQVFELGPKNIFILDVLFFSGKAKSLKLPYHFHPIPLDNNCNLHPKK